MKKLFCMFREKVICENAPLVFLVGLGPLLVASKTMMSGLVMAAAVTFVLTMSCAVISLIRDFISNSIRTVMYMLVIATFVTAVEILMRRFLPTHYANLGIYISVIASCGIVYSRADQCASKNGFSISLLDGMFTGFAFSAVIIVMSFIRELFGSGTLFGYRIIEEEYGMSLALSPAGGFILLGFFVAILRKVNLSKNRKKEEKK